MEEKKTYSVVGTVTIGTDEYRDLIETVANERQEAARQTSRWVEEYNKARKLEIELKEIKPKYENLMKFVNTEDILHRYKLWKLELQGEVE